MGKRRVVITGLGAITSLGYTVDAVGVERYAGEPRY